MAIHLRIGSFKNSERVGVGTEIRTQHLPAHWPMTNPVTRLPGLGSRGRNIQSN